MWRKRAVLVAGLLTLISVPAATAQAARPPIFEPPGSGRSTTGPLIGVQSSDGAKIIAQKWLSARTVDITVRSPAVGHDLPVRVIVPVGWRQTGVRTFPLVMVLHGGAANFTSWTRNTDIEKLSAKSDVVIAMPEAGRTAAYTDYVQKTWQGPLKWETFHTRELIQILNNGFRTNHSRAVLGISAGGYGANDYAARNPGLFKYAASFSGVMGINQFPVKQANIVGDQIQGAGFARYGVPGRDEKNWNAHDPFKIAKNLKGTGLYIYCGTGGLLPWIPTQFAEAQLYKQNQAFVALLKKDDIQATVHFVPNADHTWHSWKDELHIAWPQITKAVSEPSS